MGPEVDGRDGAPPWTLEGEAVVALARLRGDPPALAEGVDRLPGPVLVLAVHWQRSPMGPYRELAVGVPARLGPRLGWSITTMVVDSETSRRAGRENWGLPKELGRFQWRAAGDGDGPELRWEDRGIGVRCGPTWRAGPTVPLLLPVPLLQRRDDGPVSVPGRLRASTRPALVEVTAPAGEPLEVLAGRHLGAHLTGARLRMEAARRA